MFDFHSYRNSLNIFKYMYIYTHPSPSGYQLVCTSPILAWKLSFMLSIWKSVEFEVFSSGQITVVKLSPHCYIHPADCLKLCVFPSPSLFFFCWKIFFPTFCICISMSIFVMYYTDFNRFKYLVAVSIESDVTRAVTTWHWHNLEKKLENQSELAGSYYAKQDFLQIWNLSGMSCLEECLNTHTHICLSSMSAVINIPYTITLPPAWTIDTRQDGSMLLCCLHENLTLPSNFHSCNWDSRPLYQSAIDQFSWACANVASIFCS